jgi:hypothetical protein
LRANIFPANSRRKGVVAVVVALVLTGLIGVVAITVDGGLLYLELRRARSTADGAAMAAACDLFLHYPANQGTDPSGTALQAALTVASANGYTNDGTTSTVQINIPPVSGGYAGKASYTEVVVTSYVKRAFSGIFGAKPIPVRARAVSRGAWVSPAAGVIILDYSDKAALNSQGNGAFTDTGGTPVIVNSSNPSAVLVSGNGTMIASEFNITGGIQLSGNSTFQTAPTSGLIYTGMHPTPDPFAYLPQPAVPPNGTMTTTKLGGGSTLYVLTPGCYTNLPTFSSDDVVILKQASADGNGIFYINGGGFKSTGASITMDPITTGGVMLYNAPASNANSEKIQITGNSSGTVNLSGLTKGPYAGMVLWQDRTRTVPLLVEGNGAFSIQGTFYAAGAQLNVNGNGQTSAAASQIGSQYVALDLSLGGNGNVKLNYHGNTANTRIITLVE